MVTFIVRRLIATVFMLIIISMVTFATFFLPPKLGGQTSYGLAAQYVGRPTRTAVLQMKAALGLNNPGYLQYWHYLRAIVAGEHYDIGPSIVFCPPPCFGYSFKNQQPVWPMMVSDIPVTASVAFGAVILWLIGGVTAGVVSALKRGTLFDRFSMGWRWPGSRCRSSLPGCWRWSCSATSGRSSAM